MSSTEDDSDHRVNGVPMPESTKLHADWPKVRAVIDTLSAVEDDGFFFCVRGEYEDGEYRYVRVDPFGAAAKTVIYKAFGIDYQTVMRETDALVASLQQQAKTKGPAV